MVTEHQRVQVSIGEIGIDEDYWINDCLPFIDGGAITSRRDVGGQFNLDNMRRTELYNRLRS
jgi:hypothetical protein